MFLSRCLNKCPSAHIPPSLPPSLPPFPPPSLPSNSPGKSCTSSSSSFPSPSESTCSHAPPSPPSHGTHPANHAHLVHHFFLLLQKVLALTPLPPLLHMELTRQIMHIWLIIFSLSFRMDLASGPLALALRSRLEADLAPLPPPMITWRRSGRCTV